MDETEKRMLRETRAMVEENHKILRKVYGYQRWARFWRLVYWVIIIGLAFGAWYFIQPIVNKVDSVFGGFGGMIERAGKATGLDNYVQ